VLGFLAAGAARRELDPSMEGPFRKGRAWWQRAGTALAFGCVGLIGLALPRLPGVSTMTSHTPGPAATLIGLAPAVGLILLTAAAIYVWPLRWAARRVSVAGAPAAWARERRAGHHAEASVILVPAA